MWRFGSGGPGLGGFWGTSPGPRPRVRGGDGGDGGIIDQHITLRRGASHPPPAIPAPSLRLSFEMKGSAVPPRYTAPAEALAERSPGGSVPGLR